MWCSAKATAAAFAAIMKQAYHFVCTRATWHVVRDSGSPLSPTCFRAGRRRMTSITLALPSPRRSSFSICSRGRLRIVAGMMGFLVAVGPVPRRRPLLRGPFSSGPDHVGFLIANTEDRAFEEPGAQPNAGADAKCSLRELSPEGGPTWPTKRKACDVRHLGRMPGSRDEIRNRA